MFNTVNHTTMKANENHISCLNTAILIDRKHGDCFQLKHVTKGFFIAEHTTKGYQDILNLDKISKGLSIRRYRILEVKSL